MEDPKVHEMAKVSYFKNVWQTITTNDGIVPDDNVRNVLNIVKTELIKGILIYEPYTEESLNEWKNKFKLSDPGLERILHRLSICLNLHACEAWNIFCNYLVFEYYGKITDVKKISERSEYVNNLVENIWYFFTSERMYILKSVRYMLENCKNNANHFQTVYGTHVEVLIPDIRESLLKQLDYLTKEITSLNNRNCVSLKEWIDRNHREQLEVILSLIVTLKHSKMDMTQYIYMISIFKQHNFTKQPSFYEIINIAEEDDLTNIKNAEIGACLVALEHCWDNCQAWEPIRKEIDELMIKLSFEGDHAILLLAWATLQLLMPTDMDREAYYRKYLRYVSTALQHLVFNQLYEIVKCEVLMDCYGGGLIRNSIFTLLEKVCQNYNTESKDYECRSACLLFGELLKDNCLAEKCINGGPLGVTSLYNTALHLFPADFLSISAIFKAFLGYDEYKRLILQDLLKMPSYTEEYTTNSRRVFETITLNARYTPPDTDLVFPAGTSATIWRRDNKSYITIQAPCNYFALLRNMVNKIVAAVILTEDEVQSVCVGYDLLLVALNVSNALNEDEIKHCVSMVTSLMVKFSKAPYQNNLLTYTCLKICLKILCTNDESFVQVLSLHNILPNYLAANMSVAEFYRKDSINVGALFHFICEERLNYKYKTLLIYLDLLYACIKKGVQLQRIQIPGLIFITYYVFTKHIDWNYMIRNDENRIANKCFKIYLAIIQKDEDFMQDPAEMHLSRFCKECFLNNDLVIRPFLKVLRVSNNYLNLRMHGEPNWESDRMLEIFHNVRLALSIFLILLNSKNIFEEVLMRRIFPNENEKKTFLKIIAGYIQQSFDQIVAKLALKVMKKIALVSGIPMQSTLDMDFYQIQGLFLYRLRDPLVCEDVKVAIVDLITACVSSQHGMISAFFNIAQEQKGTWQNREDEPNKSGESVSEFLVEYLENIKAQSLSMQHPLQAAILELFYNIWAYRKDMLIEEIMRLDIFWPTIADPLITTSNLSDKSYGQIFSILTLELLKSNVKSLPEIRKVAEKMFSKNCTFKEKWTNYILNIVSNDESVLSNESSKLFLLKAWKNFILACVKSFPDLFDEEVQHCLLKNSLFGLARHITNPFQVNIICVWGELYLCLINTWPSTFYDSRQRIFKKVTLIIQQFGHFYNNFNEKAKQVLLAVASRTVLNMPEFLEIHGYLLRDFLEPAGEIIIKEFDKINQPENVEKRKRNQKHDMCWVLVMSLITNIVSLRNIGIYANWFQYYQVLPKTLLSLKLFILYPEALYTAKSIVNCITNYAKSPVGKDFLNINTVDFYDSIKPPVSYIDIDGLVVSNPDLWYYEEWWKLYRGIIELNTLILKKFGTLMLQNSFSFIALHLIVIQNTLKLPRVTAELTALKLAGSVLSFLVHLLKWRQFWRLENHVCFRRVMDGVKDCFNACITIILRPKLISFFSLQNENNMVPSEMIPIRFMVDIMDLIVDMLSACCKCFIQSNIHIREYLGYYADLRNQLLVERDFHVPKMNNQRCETLTFGSLLCSLHFMCKSISQITYHHSVPRPFDPMDVPDPTPQEMPFMVFVCSDFIGGYSEKFNTIQHFATSEISGLSAPWLAKLNKNQLNFALETLTTLLADEIYNTLQTEFDEPAVVQYIRRELCSELQTFHDFVRRKSIELHQQKAILELQPSSNAYLREKTNIEIHVNDYLLTIAQWFMYICQLSH